jgi:plasmid stability protein
MAQITIRDLSDKTKEALRVQAAQSGISLEALARHILQRASTEKGFKPVNILALAEKYFGDGKGIDLELPKRASTRATADFGS